MVLVDVLPMSTIDAIKANPGGAYKRMKADQEQLKKLKRKFKETREDLRKAIEIIDKVVTSTIYDFRENKT